MPAPANRSGTSTSTAAKPGRFGVCRPGRRRGCIGLGAFGSRLGLRDQRWDGIRYSYVDLPILFPGFARPNLHDPSRRSHWKDHPYTCVRRSRRTSPDKRPRLLTSFASARHYSRPLGSRLDHNVSMIVVVSSPLPVANEHYQLTDNKVQMINGNEQSRSSDNLTETETDDRTERATRR